VGAIGACAVRVLIVRHQAPRHHNLLSAALLHAAVHHVLHGDVCLRLSGLAAEHTSSDT